MKYALKKVRRIRLDDLATGKHQVTLNDLKNFQITGGQETVYAEGTDGAKLAAFDLKKVAGIKAANGSIEVGYLALQTGSEEKVVTNGTAVKLRDEIVITSATEAILSHAAVGAVGNEIGYIYKADSNGSPGEAFKQSATASATDFAYAPESKKITLPTGKFQIGETVIVDYHPTFSQYKEINNESTKFSTSSKVYVDAWFTDICTDLDVPLQMVLDKGKVSGNIDMSFGDQAAVQNIEIESLVSACNGSSQSLWKLYTYDMEEIVDA